VNGSAEVTVMKLTFEKYGINIKVTAVMLKSNAKGSIKMKMYKRNPSIHVPRKRRIAKQKKHKQLYPKQDLSE